MTPPRISMLLIAALVATACTGSDDGALSVADTDPPPTAAASTAPATAESTSVSAPPTSTAAPETTESTPPTTESPIPEPIAEEGSAQGLILNRDDVSNFATAVAAWLGADPGRQGVLRNARGVTLFVPNNDGFSSDDLAEATSDLDAFTLFLSEHLRVGALRSDQLGDSVTTAMGATYAIGEGPTIGDRMIVEADIEATNGIIHIIDGPLAPLTQ